MNKSTIKLKNSKEWADFENYYSSYNIFKQIGLFRFEDFHTNVLKSLFEENNVYGLGLYPIQKLLELIVEKDGNNLIRDLVDSQKQIHILEVEPQYYKDKTRVDLFISFAVDNLTYNIILENKIFSEEHEVQCQEYYRVYGDNERRNTFLYLSLEETPTISSNKFICITYQELIDYVIEPCAYREKNNGTMLPLYAYLASFSQLYDYMDNLSLLDKKQKLPITSTGKELTLNLYTHYKEELQNVLDANNGFYKENEKALRILFYNLFLLADSNSEIEDAIISKIKRRIFDIRCMFNFKKCTFKECTILILKYLLENNIVETEEDLKILNQCMPNRNYYVAVPELNIPHEEYYSNNYKEIGKLKLEGKELYYYAGPMTKEDLEQYCSSINENFNNVIKNIVRIEE